MAEAVATIEDVVKQQSLSTRQKDTVGQTLSHLGLHEEALPHLKAAVSEAPDDLSANYNLGTVLRHLGDIDGAERHLEKALAADPLHGLSHFSIAGLRKWDTANNHIARLEKALEQGPGTAMDRARINYAIFQEADGLKLHERAWEALQAGASICAEEMPYDLEDRRALSASLRSAFGDDIDGRAPLPADDSEPIPIFILGLPRSGTTLVEQIFAAHPDVTPMGETYGMHIALRRANGGTGHDIFSPGEVEQLHDLNWEDVRATYLDETRHLFGNTRYVTEKLPQNYAYTGAIRKAFPYSPIIHLRRNPMDSLFGAYKVLFGNDSYLWSYRQEDLAANYQLYRDMMNHWQTAMGDGLSSVILEQLISDPESEIRRLLDEAGLPFNEACLSPHKARRGVATASSVQVRRPINSSGVDAWRAYENRLAPLVASLQAMGFIDQQGNAIW
ncbi:sulfotransferase [Henriciella sp. AS95]|uniref:tetratricopeptide repeat-containing sulfotransferase family protein n=1 Tax=Henriciella sp. AS95 TaxID=3135782 RepID=UPI00316DF544